MTEVISVKFKSRGKTYFFDPNGLKVPDGAQVVVETAKGLELADCFKGNHYVADERIVPPLRPAVRIATEDDLRIAELCKAREKEAFKICEEKIAQHGLDMKLVDVECNFEGSKMLFFFTSDGRVDFRDLVKDLAGIFRTRIELRQIGVRDEAKMLGGLGMCGRPFCCNQFLDDFQPVSTKMAKTQSLSLNPTKISGACGRLMCCLRYEQDAYEELVKNVPKNGAFVETPSGYGNVAQINLLRQKVKVKLDGNDENLKTFDADEVAAVPGGRPKPGEPLPHVLKVKPKPVEKEEPEEDEWQMPELFGEQMHTQQPVPVVKESAPEQGEERKNPGSSRRRPRKKKGDGGRREAVGEESGAAVRTPEKPEGRGGEGPQQKKTSAEGDKAASGRRPRHKRYPSNGGGQRQEGEGGRSQTPAQSKKPAQPAAAKGGAGSPAAAGDGDAAKKKRNNRRRYYRPKNGSGGGAKGEQ